MPTVASNLDPLTANTGADFVRMRVDLIDPHPKNPRRVTDDHPSLPGLAETIKSVGLVNPVTVKQVGGRCMILAGERRWRAARLAGLAEVLVRVLDVNEEQEFFILNVENLQREGLHWLEEARGVEAMVARKWDVATIAKNLGRSEQWVRLRAKLAGISPKWRKAVEDPAGNVHAWPAAMLELVARFPVEQQDALLKEPIVYRLRQCGSVADLQRFFETEVTRALKAAPWDVNNATLVKKAGACSACPKRSSCQQQLFEEAKEDRCLDGTCWEEKAEAHVVAAVAAVRKEHPKAIVVGSAYEAPAQLQKQVQESWRFKVVKQGAKGAVPAVFASGDNAGRLVYVAKGQDHTGSRSSTKPAKASTPKDQLAEVMKRRARASVLALSAKLGGSAKGETYGDVKAAASDVRRPGSDVMTAMLLSFGTNGISSTYAPDWKVFQKHRAMTGEQLLEALWTACRQAMVEILSAATNTRNKDTVDLAGAETVAAACGLDWKAMKAAARDAHPLPKALEQHFDEDGKPVSNLQARVTRATKTKATHKPKAKPAAAKA